MSHESPDASIPTLEPSKQTVVMLCSCPDETSARGIATALVADGLAACVNRLPGVMSTYIWEGQLEEEREVLLVIKTAADRVDAAEQAIRARHPATLPEIVALPIVAGSRHYIEWILDSTRP